MKTMGQPGQLTVVKADVIDAAAVARALVGADYVINLVGLAPSGRHT